MPQVSVLIPCYNSSATISQCLSAVLAQKTDFDFETVVFDSSTDGTDKMIAQQFPQVALIHSDERAMAGDARNAAVAHSTGEIICFIDSDCVADPGWLQGLVDALRASDTRIMQGGARPANPAALMGLASFLMEFSGCNHLRRIETVEAFITCNLALTRQAFDEYGPFPSNMWPSEDTVMSENARRAGAKLEFSPQHKIAHINRAKWAHVFGHQRVLGYSSAQIRDMMPDLPTAWMLSRPWLTCLVVPVVRPLRTLLTLGREAPQCLPTCIFLLPLMWMNCLAWCKGFLLYLGERRGT